MRALAVIFVILLFTPFVYSALGLITPNECETKRDASGNLIYYSDSQKIKCYHTAGMSSAYLGDRAQAEAICESILTFGVATPDSDVAKMAELESNACLYDIAKIIRSPDICSRIDNQDLGTALFGDRVNQQNCLNEVCRLAQLDQAMFHTPVSNPLCPTVATNSASICDMIFIIPLILLGVWKYPLSNVSVIQPIGTKYKNALI